MLFALLVALAATFHVAPGPRADAVVNSGAARVTGLTLGSQRLQPCKPVIAGYCGHLTVPLDWLDPSDGTIAVRYEWVPARSGRSSGTIVAQEGGPGYATTGTGNSYAFLFAPLLGDRNLLMMDERGTGDSFAIDCPALQRFNGSTASKAFHYAAASCGTQLDHTFARTDGRYVHASDLFGTSQSVRDLHAVLAAVGVGPVDLYGDSYGSFFAQVFAARYPASLRSLVLDSTYQTLDQPPFDRNAQVEVRFAYAAVCARSLACNAVGGSSLDRIARLGARLDAAPLVTRSTTPNGKSVAVDVSGRDLETLLTAGAYDFGPYRTLDAAARAWLERDDAVPLARLFAWTTVGPAFYRYPYSEYSYGMALADSCTVYKNPFDIRADGAVRRAQYAEHVAALPAVFAFPLAKVDAVEATDEVYDECLSWPAPERLDPIVGHAPPLVPATLPVLIVSGDLDTTTSPGDARQVLQQVGPSARFVTIANSDHTPALGDDGALRDVHRCASTIVQRFVADPKAALEAACAERIPEIRTLGEFPLRLGDQTPALALPGNAASTAELRLAALAVSAAGDAAYGAKYLYEGYAANCGRAYCGQGLRGGTYRAAGDLSHMALSGIAFSADSRVSGTLVRSGAAFPTAPGSIGASLRATAGDLGLDETVTYDERAQHAMATLEGRTSAGRRIMAVMPAP